VHVAAARPARPERVSWPAATLNPHRLRGRRWQATRRRILERDSYQCQLRIACAGRVVSLREGVIDHRVNLAAGGTNDDDNLRAACRPCNDAKRRIEARDSAVLRRNRRQMLAAEGGVGEKFAPPHGNPAGAQNPHGVEIGDPKMVAGAMENAHTRAHTRADR